MTVEEFITKAIMVHGNKYNYEKVVFEKMKDYIIIGCEKHGDFTQNVDKHLRGRGCPNCAHNKKHTTEEIIKMFKKVHGELYDYSKVEYINLEKNVIINCKIHGDVEVKPKRHIAGGICPKCLSLIKDDTRHHTLEHVLSKFKNKHGDRYDYSKVVYVDDKTKVNVICKEHGIFSLTPSEHLCNRGCPKCVVHKNYTVDIAKTNFIKKHGDKYDYSLFNEYNGVKTLIDVICPIHGVFKISYASHINGSGCQKCGKKYIYNQEEIIERFNKKHNSFYDYSLVKYVDMKKKVKIICPAHGIFEQSPSNHIYQNGCPKCRMSVGETIINNILVENSIDFLTEHTFPDCKYKSLLMFDFYLPEIKTCIEFNGIQHYEPVDYFGGEKAFKSQIKKDKTKEDYCIKNKINLIVIKYDDDITSKLIENKIINVNYSNVVNSTPSFV